jgi:putative transposase
MLIRKRDYTLRSIFNAIFYVLKNGCGWRDIPGDLPPTGITYYYFKTWRNNGLLEYLCQELGGDYRELVGKKRSPSVGIADAQSVKNTAVSGQTDSGYDAGKKVKGRKRHLMVDTLGLIICVWVTAADWQDRTAAYWLFVKAYMNRFDFPRLKVFFADGGVSKKYLIKEASSFLGSTIYPYSNRR